MNESKIVVGSKKYCFLYRDYKVIYDVLLFLGKY